MATKTQTAAAKKNVKKAQDGAKKKKALANMPKATKTALGKQGAAVAQRKRIGGDRPKTRQELYEEAKRRDLQGRSKMGRDELARAWPVPAIGQHLGIAVPVGREAALAEDGLVAGHHLDGHRSLCAGPCR
jgi:hypothetical protein